MKKFSILCSLILIGATSFTLAAQTNDQTKIKVVVPCKEEIKTVPPKDSCPLNTAKPKLTTAKKRRLKTYRSNAKINRKRKVLHKVICAL